MTDLQTSQTAIVIPAFNEAASIGAVLDSLQWVNRCHVIVVDDYSTDATAAIARKKGCVVLRLPLQLGAWGAIQAGLRYALKKGYQQVVTMDADGQHQTDQLRKLMTFREKHRANVVIGTCPGRLSIGKRLAWAYFRLITGLRLEDLTSGFRIYDRQAMRTLAAPVASLLDFQDVGVLLLLKRAGLDIIEVPVDMSQRQDGKSKVFYSWWMVARYMLQTSALCVAKVGQAAPVPGATDRLTSMLPAAPVSDDNQFRKDETS